jgi:hypothetical protein
VKKRYPRENSGQSVVRWFFIGIEGLHGRNVLEFFAQKRQRGPQFPDFLLLLYDNHVQIINRFLQIYILYFNIFHSFLHWRLLWRFEKTLRGTIPRHIRP